MIRKLSIAFLLVAFMNYIIGCTSITYNEKTTVEHASVEKEKINQLVLKDGLTVDFNQNGGTFIMRSEGLQGSTDDGKPVFVLLSQVVELRIRPPHSAPEAELEGTTITEVVLRSRDLISFDKIGARYEKERRIITGRRANGETFSFPVDRIFSIRTTKPEAVATASFLLNHKAPVYEAVLNDGTLIVFDSLGAHYVDKGGVFVGKDTRGQSVQVPADEVLYANVTKADVALNVLATLGVIMGVFGVLFLIALATKQSCPFVYSFDGNQYVFDAEPLGGAICPGLKRTDVSRLEHVQPIGGEYKLLVRNEVPETQYIDQLELLVVDHPAETKVYPDLENRFFPLTRVYDATCARDENGMSLMNFVHERDNVAWQTHLPSASATTSSSLRHQITITFPKPRDAKTARLVTNVGTSSWGSNMIRKMLEYRGDKVDSWLSSVRPGSEAYAAMYQFLEREELYYLKVWVKEGNSWTPRAVLRGQGPLISEDRICALDVSNAPGDSLTLRLNPPMGFWTMDYIGVSYEETFPLQTANVAAQWAENDSGVSLARLLRSEDNEYYSMPRVGDWAKISFNMPQQKEGLTRTVFLKTSGYYELHLKKDQPEQTALLHQLGMIPGLITKIAMLEFRNWQAQRQAMR